MMYQLVKETGWTWHYILWRVSWANLILMMADRPGFRRKGKDAPKKLTKEAAAALRQQLR